MEKILSQKNNGRKGFTPTPVLVWFRKVKQILGVCPLAKKGFIARVAKKTSLVFPAKQVYDFKTGLGRNQAKPFLARGFTLLEMLVAVTLFTIITTMSIGSLITVFDANRKTQTLRTVMENLNFTMEGMSREIKFGTKYYCSSLNTPDEITTFNNIDTLGELEDTVNTIGGDCGGGIAIAFKSQTGNLIRYTFVETGSGENAVGKIEQTTIGTGLSGTPTSITAPEIDVDKLRFFVVGSSPTDTFQPRATISMNGHTGIAGANSNTDSSFSLQTTVSQRELDQL